MNDYLAGATSTVETIFLQDSTVATGAGKTGLVFNTSGLTCYYKRSNGTASVAVTLVTITTLGTFASGGFKEIDSTGMPGTYEFHPPDAAFASGAKEVTFFFTGATGLAQRPIKFRLLAVNPDNGANFGMSNLAVAPLSTLGSVSPMGWITAGSFAAAAITSTVAPNLDASVSSRSIFAGGAVASVTSPVTVGTNTDKTGYTVSTVQDKTGYSLTQAFPGNFAALAITSGGAVAIDGSKSPAARNQDAVTAPTYDDCLVGAWVEAFGKEPVFNNTSWVKQLPSNIGPIRTFVITVDGSGNVTARN
jgi:hypothetical protein